MADWDAVSVDVGTKNVQQSRSHAYEYFNELQREYTKSDDAILQEKNVRRCQETQLRSAIMLREHYRLWHNQLMIQFISREIEADNIPVDSINAMVDSRIKHLIRHKQKANRRQFAGAIDDVPSKRLENDEAISNQLKRARVGEDGTSAVSSHYTLRSLATSMSRQSSESEVLEIASIMNNMREESPK